MTRRNQTCGMPGRGLSRAERGMVTVEVALSMLALAVVVAVAIWFAGAAFLMGHCQLTADEVARQHARGDRGAVARASADAPAGARVDARSAGGQTVVVVSAEARIGPWSWPVRAEARVIDEAPR